jgi:hypothetical protein
MRGFAAAILLAALALLTCGSRAEEKPAVVATSPLLGRRAVARGREAPGCLYEFPRVVHSDTGSRQQW